MGGAIIYLVIVAVWAVVLVPRWLRAHDVAAPAEPDHVPEPMPEGRVLTRRGPAAPPPELSVPGRPMAQPRTDNVRKPSSTGRAVRARRTVRRHRAAFAILLFTAAACAGGAWYDYLPPWAAALPLGVLPLYLVHVRRVIVTEHVRRRRAGVASSRPAPAELSEREPAIAGSRSDNYAGNEVFDQYAPDRWSPQPVPSPSYLTAPRAPRAYRSTVSVGEYDERPADGDAEVLPLRPAVGD